MSRLCELCGADRARTRLGWFAEGGVKTIDRCDDESACQARVEADGSEWPLLSKRQLEDRSRQRDGAFR